MTTKRWQYLLSPFMNIQFIFLLATSYIACFVNGFLPTWLGGDVVKAFLVYKKVPKSLEIISSVLMDRIVGFTTISVVAVFSLPFIKENRDFKLGLSIFTVIIVIIFLGLWMVPTKLPLLKRFKKVRDCFLLYNRHSRLVWEVIGISLLNYFIYVITIYMLTQALWLNISFWYLFIYLPVILLITSLPLSPNAIGIREGAFIYFLSRQGNTPEQAFALSLLTFALGMFLSFAGGIIYFFFNPTNFTISQIKEGIKNDQYSGDFSHC